MYSKTVKTQIFSANILAENSLRYCSIDFQLHILIMVPWQSLRKENSVNCVTVSAYKLYLLYSVLVLLYSKKYREFFFFRNNLYERIGIQWNKMDIFVFSYKVSRKYFFVSVNFFLLKCEFLLLQNSIYFFC